MSETNLMEIDDHVFAAITFDPEIEMFRGEILGLSGGADFYAATVKQLHREGRKSLKEYLAMCKERGYEPFKHYSGRLNLRMSAELHERVAARATASSESINSWIIKRLEEDVA